MIDHLYDGDTFEHRGYTFRVNIRRDENMGEPWKEHDGHGVVSDWTWRDKAPGERILCEDRESKRYYNVAESTKLARNDGWGCQHSKMVNGKFESGHPTKGEAIACAVESDYDRLRGWCNDDWQWVYVVVTQIDEDEDGGTIDGGRASLSGIESDSDDYIVEVAHELADEIVGRLEVEEPHVQLSEN